MSGIFPEGGVPCGQTFNAACNIPMKNGCEGHYYSSRCLQQIDPMQMNALISEIGNVFARAGTPYDCARLDNLATAIQKLIMNQDALTRTWVLGLIEALRLSLTQKIDGDILNLRNTLNLRMDGLLFECLKQAFPSYETYTDVMPLGVGKKGSCTQIVRMAPAGPPPSPDITFNNISSETWGIPNGTLRLNEPIRNTRGRTVQIFTRGVGGESGGGSGGGGGSGDQYTISYSISKNGSTWFNVGSSGSGRAGLGAAEFLLPHNWYYRLNSNGGSYSSGVVTEMY